MDQSSDMRGKWSRAIARSAILRAAAASIGWLLLYSAVLIPAIIWAPHASPAARRVIQLYAEAAGLATNMLVGWFVARTFERKSLAEVGWARNRWARALAIGLIVGSAQLLLALFILHRLGAAHRQPSPAPAALALLTVALASLLNAALQEVWVRGILQRILSDRYGAAIGILSSSAIFVAFTAVRFTATRSRRRTSSWRAFCSRSHIAVPANCGFRSVFTAAGI